MHACIHACTHALMHSCTRALTHARTHLTVCYVFMLVCHSIVHYIVLYEHNAQTRKHVHARACPRTHAHTSAGVRPHARASVRWILDRTGGLACLQSVFKSSWFLCLFQTLGLWILASINFLRQMCAGYGFTTYLDTGFETLSSKFADWYHANHLHGGPPSGGRRWSSASSAAPSVSDLAGFRLHGWSPCWDSGSQKVWLKQNLNFNGWNSHVQSCP